MPDQTKPMSQIAKMLHASRPRIEQNIARNYFREPLFTEPGKAREWTLSEVVRLAMFLHLMDDVGLPAKDAGELTASPLHGFKDDRAMFVAYKTHAGQMHWQSEIVRASDLGDFLKNGCEIVHVLQAGHDAETLRRNSEKLKTSAYVAIIVDLDAVADKVTKAWNSTK